MVILFACRRNRLGDIGLIRLGIASAGHQFRLMVLPWAIPLVLLAALGRLLGVRMHLIISDKFIGDTVLARLFGRECTRMMWNYADEWPAAGIRLPRHKTCFFSEKGQAVDSFLFAPQPQRPALRLPDAPRRPIVFVGDVTLEFPLPRGAEWWRERFAELRDTHGYAFYLRPEYEALISQELPGALERRTARLLAKNLLRLWIVQVVRKNFGERLILLGSNWRRFGMSSEASLYAVDKRLQFYRSALVNLDCGSKSGDSALYPRSSELISFAGGLLQVRCVDTEVVFGECAREFSFDADVDLLATIESRLAEPEGRRGERAAWLADRLRERHFLMQHSVNAMLLQARRLPAGTC